MVAAVSTPTNAIGQLIRHLREEHGWTQDELAEKVSLSRAAIGFREQGRSPVRGRPERSRFAKAFGLSLDDFDAMWRGSRIERTRGGTERQPIPVINSAPAGDAIDYEEYGLDSGQGYEYVDGLGVDDELAFAVRVVGDSMEPTIGEGDLLIFSPMGVPRPKAELIDGAVVFIRFSAESDRTGCTVARWFGLDDEMVELRKDNVRHRPMIVRREHLEQVAVCVQKRTARL